MAGIFFSCENDPNDVAKFNMEDDQPDQTTKDIEVIYTDSGRVNYSLKAGLREEYIPEKLTKVKNGFVVNMYNKQGELKAYLLGRNGEIYTHDRKLKATDSVVFNNLEKDQVIFTEELIWDQRTRKIFTSKAVKIIEQGNKVLLGTGLITDENFTEPVIINPGGHYYLKKKDSTNTDENI